MDITDYTSHDEIRTTCGLSTDELPDTILSVELYGNALELGLGSATLPAEAPGPGPLATRYLAIKAIAEGSRTLAEQKLYNLTRMFSTYTVAQEVVRSLSMRAPKGRSDSKTTLTRFSPESTYLKVKEDIEGKLSELLDAIENINATEVVGLTLLGIASPAVDPVTGS